MKDSEIAKSYQEILEREKHLNNVLRGIRNVNQLIVQEDDPYKLISKACANLTETLSYHNAWIALFDANREITHTASSGFDHRFEILSRQLKEGSMTSCIELALTQDSAVVIDNPDNECRDCPLANGYEGRAAFCRQLVFEGKLYGVLAASVPKKYAHDEEQHELFNEVAGDIAFALHKIEMTRNLRGMERIINRSQSVAYIARLEEGFPIEFISESIHQFGWNSEDLYSGKSSFAGMLHPDDRERVLEELAGYLNEENRTEFIQEYRVISDSGKTFWVRDHTWFRRNREGKVTHLEGIINDISEHKLVEMKLKDSDRIFRHARDMFCIAGFDGYFKVLNPAWETTLGWTVEEMKSRPWNDFVHPDDKNATDNIKTELLDGSEVLLFRNRYRCRDGSYKWLSWNSFPYKNEKIMFGVARDITKMVDQDDRISMLGKMLDDSPASITVHNTEGRFVYANKLTVSMHGYENLEEFLNVNLHDLDLPESEALLQERFEQIAKNGQASFEVEHYRKDGSSFPLEVTAKSINWQGQAAILSIARDITERRAAENALRESEESFRTLFNESPVSILVHDKDNGAIIDANKAAYEAHGFSSLAELQSNATWMEPPYSAADALVRIQKAANGEFQQFEWTNSDKNGEIFWEQVYLRKIILNDVERVLATCVDITSAKRAQEARDSLNEQLNQIQKLDSIGRLAGGVAHDFNNMLGVIIGYTQMAMGKTGTDDPIFRNLDETLKAAQKAANITRQLLAFARKQTVNPKAVDLNESIEDILKMIRRLIGENIDFSWQPGSSVWPVKIDPAQMDQIMANLCLNARDAIGDTGTMIIETENVTIDENYCRKRGDFSLGDYVVLSISDNGHGMSPETIENIFEPFFTTKEPGEGTGLGLATVYGIVKQNNGFINVYSELNQGTTFKIYFPRHDGELSQSGDRDETELKTGNGETILVVEDEAAILDITEIILDELGYKVLASSSPREAISIAENHGDEIKLLISDVIMPEMNGRELSAKLKKIHPAIKVLFMSGYTANVIAHQSVLDSDINFIQKPFSRMSLAEKVYELINTAP